MGFSTGTNDEVCSRMSSSRPLVTKEKPALISINMAALEDSIEQILAKEDEEVLPQHISRAAVKGDQEVVLEWLGLPPIPARRINAMWRGHTLLHEAVAGNRTELVKALLELGADVDPKSSSGFTPLEEALLYNCSGQAARLLLTWGATLDPQKVIASDNTELFQLIKAPLGGRHCVIEGLQNYTSFNGKTGVATKYLPKEDIYQFHIEGNKRSFTIGSKNLRRLDHNAAKTSEHSGTSAGSLSSNNEDDKTEIETEKFPRLRPRLTANPIEEWGFFPADFGSGEMSIPIIPTGLKCDTSGSDQDKQHHPVESPVMVAPRFLQSSCGDRHHLTPP